MSKLWVQQTVKDGYHKERFQNQRACETLFYRRLQASGLAEQHLFQIYDQLDFLPAKKREQRHFQAILNFQPSVFAYVCVFSLKQTSKQGVQDHTEAGPASTTDSEEETRPA